jgi:hypothetical protein
MKLHSHQVELVSRVRDEFRLHRSVLMQGATGSGKTAVASEIIRMAVARGRRNVPDAVRRERFAAYGISWNDRSRYELDHLVPLEIGGSNDSTNLWPEPLKAAARKDQVENELHREVCRGAITVEAAQRTFETDWTSSMPRWR